MGYNSIGSLFLSRYIRMTTTDLFTLSPYARDDLDDNEVLQREIDKLILAARVSEIEPEDAKCVTSIFLVEKKPDPENPQGSSRPCTI